MPLPVSAQRRKMTICGISTSLSLDLDSRRMRVSRRRGSIRTLGAARGISGGSVYTVIEWLRLRSDQYGLSEKKNHGTSDQGTYGGLHYSKILVSLFIPGWIVDCTVHNMVDGRRNTLRTLIGFWTLQSLLLPSLQFPCPHPSHSQTPHAHSLGGIFKLELFLPEEYPMNPPKVRFLTKI